MNLHYNYAFSTEKWSQLQLSGKRSYSTFKPFSYIQFSLSCRFSSVPYLNFEMLQLNYVLQ